MNKLVEIEGITYEVIHHKGKQRGRCTGCSFAGKFVCLKPRTYTGAHLECLGSFQDGHGFYYKRIDPLYADLKAVKENIDEDNKNDEDCHGDL